MRSGREVGPFVTGWIVVRSPIGLRASPGSRWSVGVVTGGSHRRKGTVYVRKLGVRWASAYPYDHWLPLG